MLTAALVTSTFALVGCSSLPSLSGNKEKAAATAEEKAGRITMVLSEEALVASPELATEAIALPTPELIATWGQAGSSSDKVIGHSNAASELSVAWRANIGEGSGKKSALTAPPVANETTVYTLDSEQKIVATDLATGARRWSKKLKGLTARDKIGIGGGLAVEGDTLIVASGFGFVSALNAADGSEKWQRKMGAPMTGSPTIRQGRIFVGSNNNEIFALNFETGETEWSDQAIAETARVLSSPSPAAVEDFVIAPYSSGEVIAYRASNGRRLWTDAISQAGRFTPISEINDIGSRPVLSGGLVFAASQSGVTVAIDGRSGNRVWSQPIGSTQAPALAGPYMFVAGIDGTLAALKPGTGEAYWVVQLPTYENAEKKKKRISYSGPVVASGRILLIASTGELLAFSPQTGERVGAVKLGDVTYIEPIVVQDKLLALTDKGTLVAIR
jgi:outer membrane protein assembly factor BamB